MFFLFAGVLSYNTIYLTNESLYTCVNCVQTTGNVSAYKSINETRYKSVCIL